MTVLSKRIVPAIIATAAPAVTDDETKGYKVGMWWFDTTHTNVYWCKSIATGAADWENVSGGGGSGTVTGGDSSGATGVEVFDAAASDASTLAFKTLLSGANVTITDNGDGTITIAASGGGGGSTDLNAAYDAYILTEASLISYFPMDEASGNFLDRKGSNDLVNAGDLRYGFPGPIPGADGNAAFWKASGSTACKANCASPTGLPTGAAPWTVEAWYRYAVGATGDEYLIYFGSLSIRQAIALAVYYSGTANEIAASTAGDDAIAGPSEGLPYTSDAQWHHVAAAYDGSTGLKIYWDGELANSHTLGGAMNIVIDGTGLGVGYLTGSSNFIRGGVAKAAVYGAALSASAIRKHYMQAKLGFAP